MRQITDYLLFGLQWVLMGLGGLQITSAVRNYFRTVYSFSTLPRPINAPDSYIALGPTLLVGLTLGLVSVGLGAILFYLRRLYLARR